MRKQVARRKKRTLIPKTRGGQKMTLKRQLTLGAVTVGTFALLISFFMMFSWITVEGDERVVVQDWNDGVQDEILGPGTHFYMPLTTTVYKYRIGAEKFIMGKGELYNGEGSDFVDYPAFTVTTGGSGKEQPATFSVTLNYRLDPGNLVALHNSAQSNYEDLKIKPNLIRILSDMATTRPVLDFYSGGGRVQLQKDIEVAITEHSALSEIGIIVDTFVIDDIALDDRYVAEITGRQIATQKKLRAIEEAAAAQETAKKVEAEAEADKLKKIVEAEAKKQERIKAAEAKKEEVELAAQADANKIKAKAAAERYRKEQDAKGLLAQGLAEAKVAREKRDARYAGESGMRQTQVEIMKSREAMFKNMKLDGIIPEKTALTIINGGPAPLLTIPATK